MIHASVPLLRIHGVAGFLARRSINRSKSSPHLFLSCTRPINNKETWLVVGDGDLSYSASLLTHRGSEGSSSSLCFDPSKHHLIATVWEDKETHQRTYKDSTLHSQTILDHQQTIRFGIDATRLEHEFPPFSLDRIIFNFPHWRGKANIRRNRELVDEFLCSCAKVLKKKKSSEIRMALSAGQGGCDVNSLDEWKSSWMPHVYAAHYDLVLRCLEPFSSAQYNLSSHRGVDRGFSVESPQTYIFSRPGSTALDKHLQVAFRHEIRIILDPVRIKENDLMYTEQELIESDIVPRLVQSCTPEGIHTAVPLRDVILPIKRAHSLLVFLVIYSGECRPLTRQFADTIREKVETAVVETLQLEVAKAGRMVSRPFSNHLMASMLQECRDRL